MILLMKYKLCQLIEHQIGSAIIQKNAHNRNIEVLIAAAGDSAHLPGMVASLNSLPVIGFPVKLIELDGLESMLSIVQMPGGVPVAIVGIKIKTYAKIENRKLRLPGSKTEVSSSEGSRCPDGGGYRLGQIVSSSTVPGRVEEEAEVTFS